MFAAVCVERTPQRNAHGYKQRHLSYIDLDREANEALLLHGTSSKNVVHTVKQSFDDHMAGRERTVLVYILHPIFALGRHIRHEQLLCNPGSCVHGHPYMATGPMLSAKRPPIVQPYGVPYDSVIARPGTPKGRGRSNPQTDIMCLFSVF